MKKSIPPSTAKKHPLLKALLVTAVAIAVLIGVVCAYVPLCYYYGEFGKYKPYTLLPVGGTVHRDNITDFHFERLLDIYILSGMGAEDERCDAVRDFETKLTTLGGVKGVFYCPVLSPISIFM